MRVGWHHKCILSWSKLISLFRPVSIAQDEVIMSTATIFAIVLEAREEWRSCCLVLISHSFRWVFKHLFAIRIDVYYLCISVVLEFLRTFLLRRLALRALGGLGFVQNWRLGIRLLVRARPPLVRERIGLGHRDILKLLF